MNLPELIGEMQSCDQAEGWTIYQHGVDVSARYRDLYDLLTCCGFTGDLSWSLSDETLEQLRKLAPKALTPNQAALYHIYHDCGKPFCLTIGENGRRHFPDHAKISGEIFRRLFPGEDASAQLIEMDMLCHTLKPSEAEELCKSDLASTLCLTAWAELHSNAENLFGGFESTSFKIKRKQLSKLTKCISELS